MRADLHTHSSCSDGTDSPGELVRAAAAARLDVVALTDHDTAAGWAQARAVADEVGIGFVPGIEISARYAGVSVHLLAYGVDPAHPGLAAELDRILTGRNRRLPTVLERLRGAGLDLSEADVRAVAGSAAALGRPHVADAMVAAGMVRDRRQAFDDFLMPGRPGFVPRYAAPLSDVLRLVQAAGGVSVLAHPWSRGGRRVLTPQVLAELSGLGLTGLEAWHRGHSDDASRRLAALAAPLDLVATGSSDYHGTGKVDHDLGCHTTPEPALRRLLAAMGSAADAARLADASLQPEPAVLR